MRNYLNYFFQKFTYPEEACDALMCAYDAIDSKKSLKTEFQNLLNAYSDNMNCDFKGLLRSMKELSGKADIHEYTGHLLLVICMSKKLKDYYEQACIDEDIWFASMCDLKWKLMECKCVYDIWGTFVADWFDRFFDMTRFAIGKLQFELIPFHENYEQDGLVLTPDSTVINVHIPRTGSKLDRESQLKAYNWAAEFFGKRYQLDQIVFACHSWLLFPRNKEVLSPASNLYSFISDYDIIKQGEYEDYRGVWRLFDQNYNGKVEELPQNTSLRRAYADWIEKGQKTGWGYGVYIYE